MATPPADGTDDQDSLWDGEIRGSVNKAMTLLSVLISDGRPLRLAALARRTGLPKSTVHRLIGVLRAYDMVGCQTDGYVVGERLGAAGRPAGGDYLDRLRRVAVPHLVDLHKATGAAISLGVLCGSEVHYLDRIYTRGSVRTPSYDDDRAPAHCTAIGKVLLAYQEDGMFPVPDDPPLVSLTPSTITRPAQLCAELFKVRRDGVGFSLDEYVSGVACVAGAVSGIGRHPVAAIAVSARNGSLNLDLSSRLIRRTAFALSGELRRYVAWKSWGGACAS